MNDVSAIEELLTSEQFGFPRQNILKLTSPAGDAAYLATRKNILNAFRTHLVENKGIKAGDIVVVYYSGHGSQIPDVHQDEEDGYDETLAPCDIGPDRSNPDHVLDISDDEISLLLDKLAERTQNINLFFDSCHSGTVTRDLQDAEGEDAQGQARWLPPATCEAPTQTGLPVGRGTRSMGPSGWMPLSDGYVAISACHASERARERNFFSYTSQKRKRHGVLTYFLLKALRDVGPETTYYDVWDEVRIRVNEWSRWQNPQIEGAFERRVFGGAALPRRRYVEVTEKGKDTVTLAAGLVHGATVGSRFAIYQQGVQTFEDKAASVAIVKLTEVDTFASIGTVEGGDIAQVTVGAPAIEIEHDYGAMQMAVQVVGEGSVLDAVRQGINASPLLVLTATGDQLSTATVRLRYPFHPDGSENTSGGKKLCILGSGDGHPLVEPVVPDAEGPAMVRSKLEHIARYYNVLDIRNMDRQSRLKGKIRLRLFKVTGQDENELDLLEPIERDKGGDIVSRFGDRVVLEADNLSDQPLHVIVLDCDTQWGVEPIFPRAGATDDLVPAHKSRRTIRFRVNLPEHQMPVRENLPLPRETVKLIATTERVDFRSLWLPGTRDVGEIKGRRSSLYHLVELAVDGGAERATRSLEEDADPVVKDWTSDELVFHITT